MSNCFLHILGLSVASFFDKLLDAYCPRVRGKQFILRRSFVSHVPLPRLDDKRIRSRLETIGRRIHAGRKYDRESQEAIVMQSYGLLSPDSRDGRTPRPVQPHMIAVFRELADELELATGHLSKVDKITRHPLYRAIVSLGPNVVPLLLKDMRTSPGFWSPALTELTGADPVPENAETLKEIAMAWIEWAAHKPIRRLTKTMKIAIIEKLFPRLRGREGIDWHLTSLRAKGYNCIAYAGGDRRRRWDVNKGEHWPKGVRRGHSFSCLVNAYQAKGFVPCTNNDGESYDPDFDKIVLYCSRRGKNAIGSMRPSFWKTAAGPASLERLRTSSIFLPSVWGVRTTANLLST